MTQYSSFAVTFEYGLRVEFWMSIAWKPVSDAPNCAACAVCAAHRLLRIQSAGTWPVFGVANTKCTVFFRWRSLKCLRWLDGETQQNFETLTKGCNRLRRMYEMSWEKYEKNEGDGTRVRHQPLSKDPCSHAIG